MRADYVLYKSRYAGRLSWRVRFFWDEGSQKYLASRDLDIPVEGVKGRWKEADDKARALLSTLERPQSALQIAVPDPGTPPQSVNHETLLIPYILHFWTPQSEYAREQASVNKTPLCAAYIRNNRRDIELHALPYPPFQNLPLSNLTRKHLRDFKIWLAENGRSGRKINIVLQAMRIPVRCACADGDLLVDPFFNVGKAFHKEKEKGILSAEEIELLKTSTVTDYYARLSVLLAGMCGMRRGEIRGLQWGDIGDGIITIRHNFVDGDGLKNPKRKGGLIQENTRTVPLFRAIADLLNTLIALAESDQKDDAPKVDIRTSGYFVIKSMRREKNVPVSGKYFDHALKRELVGIGISVEEQKARNLTFHSLRHTFVTYGRLKGLSDFEIQALAGHGPKMMERYSHAQQALDMKSVGKRLEARSAPKKKKAEALPAPQ
jgi:integrase